MGSPTRVKVEELKIPESRADSERKYSVKTEGDLFPKKDEI